MIDLKHFIEKLESFPSNYMNDFDEFWKWKLENESENEHILDDDYQEETYEKLSRILRSWQYSRSGRGYEIDPWTTLKDSFRKISDAYNQIRKYTLLEFSKVPNESLESIWHELGCVKESDGNKNPGGYYNVISICKPLMLLWGQTLAFDLRVRENIPRGYNVSKHKTRWKFEKWSRVMERFQGGLKQNSEVVDLLKKVSLRKYGTNSIVPYGRFLDIYYF